MGPGCERVIMLQGLISWRFFSGASVRELIHVPVSLLFMGAMLPRTSCCFARCELTGCRSWLKIALPVVTGGVPDLT